MSTSLALAAVTATLRNLLETELGKDIPGTKVSTQPPDKVRTNGTGGQLNLFLYQTSINAAWRNADVPWRGKPGEAAPPPLPLNLHYLITAYYGDSEEGVDTSATLQLLGSHRLLGKAMSILHDHPVLGAAEINLNLPQPDRLAQPYDQVEHVRITPQPLSLDDLSKIWTGFQTQYRVSAAYEVGVVLIESTRTPVAALPVLKRGKDDEGLANMPALPAITDVRLPNGRTSALLGDTITIAGRNLDGTKVDVRLTNLAGRLAVPVVLPAAGTADEVTVQIPDEPSNWPAGLYSLEVMVLQADGKERVTEAVPLGLAPQITLLTAPLTRDAAGVVLIALKCLPQVRPDQDVILWLGSRAVRPQTISTPLIPGPPPRVDPNAPTDLTFRVASLKPGDYWVRLRVDEEDSLLVDRSTTPPRFDPTQMVNAQ